MHVFDPCNPRPVLPEFFFVIGCHKPGKLVAVLVISSDDVSSHSLWSCCRGFMRGVPVLASDSGYYPRSGMLPLARSLGRSNLRPQLAEIMPAILWLQRMISHYSIEPCRITYRKTQSRTAVTNRLLAPGSCLLPPGSWLGRGIRRNDRSSFSRERSDGDCGFGRFNGYKPGYVLSSHRASELTGQSPLPLLSPVSCLQRLIDQSCFPSSSRFAPSSFRLRLPVCDRFREPHDLT